MVRYLQNACLVVLSLCLSSEGVSGAWIRPLGVLDANVSGAYSHAAAISADGVWVVGDSSNASGLSQPFRWSPATGLEFLGNPSGGTGYATGVALRNDGALLVAGNIGGIGRRWSSSTGSWSVLPPSTLCRTAESNAMTLTPDGADAWIVGSEEVRTGCNGLAYIRGYRYAVGTETRTGPVQGLDSKVYLLGAAADGTASGYEKIPGSERAVYWPGSGAPVRIGCLSDKPGQARAISRDGRMVVGHVTISGIIHAFRWSVGQADCVDLGALAPTEHAYALASDADGGMVGGYSYSVTRPSGQTAQAAIWDEQGIHRVADLLAAAGTDMSGWVALNNVRSISDDGWTICGDGLYDADGSGPRQPIQMAYAARIPEPVSVLSMAAALVLAAGHRRVRRSAIAR